MRVRSGKHNRLLLVWVIPYLLLALSDGGLHHHPPSDLRFGAATDARAARTVLTGPTSSSDTECSACRWSLDSVACHFTCATPIGEQPAAGATRISVLAPDSDVLLDPSGRSPPAR